MLRSFCRRYVYSTNIDNVASTFVCILSSVHLSLYYRLFWQDIYGRTMLDPHFHGGPKILGHWQIYSVKVIKSGHVHLEVI